MTSGQVVADGLLSIAPAHVQVYVLRFKERFLIERRLDVELLCTHQHTNAPTHRRKQGPSREEVERHGPFNPGSICKRRTEAFLDSTDQASHKFPSTIIAIAIVRPVVAISCFGSFFEVVKVIVAALSEIR